MVLFMDGMSHYSVNELGQKWTTKTDSFVTWAVLAEGRTDGCIKRTSTTNNTFSGALTFSPLFMQTGAWTQTASGVFGCALKVDDLARISPTPPNTGAFTMNDCFFRADNGTWTMFGIALNPNGTFSLYQLVSSAGPPTLLATSLAGIDNNEWAYIEIKWTISSGGGGSLIIRSNGTPILTYTGVLYPDPFPFTPPSEHWNSITVLQMTSTTTPFLVCRMCDVYLADQNSPNGNFLGDVRIAYIKPDGVGAQSGWTPFPGAPNWNKVNEVPPDGDTTYVEATGAGARDTYTFENVIGDPVAIQVCDFLKKLDASGASVSVITRQGGVDFDGPAQGLGTTVYDYILQPYDTNPSTGVAWTKAQMDAGEWGPLKAS